eukprot:TRINITY_DN51189_c0_g1_i1.p1 TRINITY_DN51189_c0_g1~~TRINITY_DN51189_c0_g1_i1.p1  ORF type:complete len:280 (-),score=57.47 TRINITY_DN51189_c0_g1_i1:720-1559(-)
MGNGFSEADDDQSAEACPEHCLYKGRSPTAPILRGGGECPSDAGSLRPLRLLCLHGRGSSNAVTEMQVNHLGLAKVAQCEYLHGPCRAQAFNSVVEEFFKGNFYEWHRSTGWQGLQRAVQRVLECCALHGPYDGIFGFSQGAGLATLLSRTAVLRRLGIEDGRPPWRFVICACGVDQVGLPKDLPPLPSMSAAGARNCEGADEELINLPSFHIIGSWDWLRFWSARLQKSYAGGSAEDARQTKPLKRVHYINEGHELPMRLLQDKELIDSLRDFLHNIP